MLKVIEMMKGTLMFSCLELASQCRTFPCCSQGCILADEGLPAVKDIFIFFCISRPRDPSNPIRAEFSSNLPHRMLQMVGYEPENDPTSLDFQIYTNPCVFQAFSVLWPAGAFGGKKHVPGFLEHALSGFDSCS